MKPESPNAKAKRCDGLIIDNGEFRRRWIDEITFYASGKPPKTLRGARLPDSLVLDTGKSQEAVTVLELFSEKVKSPPVVYTLPVEPDQGRLGRDAVIGVSAVIVFQILLAIANAMASAMSSQP
jgi:hypothetical protein